MITGVELLTTRPRFRSFFSIHTNSDVTCSYSNKVRGLCRLLIFSVTSVLNFDLCVYTRARVSRKGRKDGKTARMPLPTSTSLLPFSSSSSFPFLYLVLPSSALISTSLLDYMPDAKETESSPVSHRLHL